MSDTPESVEVENPPIVRDKGKFVKGVSGNPKGRVKGSRNHITVMRLETEEALRDFLQPKAKKILAKAVSMALEGNEKMLAVLLDKMLSTLRNEDVGEMAPTEVKVQINNLTSTHRDRVAPPDVQVIEATATPVKPKLKVIDHVKREMPVSAESSRDPD
jgi:hypothetical protein